MPSSVTGMEASSSKDTSPSKAGANTSASQITPKRANGSPYKKTPEKTEQLTEEEKKELQTLLTAAEKELAELIHKKRQIDRNLATVEANIYALEGTYLDETVYGNIIRGFDGYLANASAARFGRRGMGARKWNESDRIFSQSSVTYLKALESRQKEEERREANRSPSTTGRGGTHKKQRLT